MYDKKRRKQYRCTYGVHCVESFITVQSIMFTKCCKTQHFSSLRVFRRHRFASKRGCFASEEYQFRRVLFIIVQSIMFTKCCKTQHFSPLRGASKGGMTTSTRIKSGCFAWEGYHFRRVLLIIVQSIMFTKCCKTQHFSSLRGAGKGVMTTSVRIKKDCFASERYQFRRVLLVTVQSIMFKCCKTQHISAP